MRIVLKNRNAAARKNRAADVEVALAQFRIEASGGRALRSMLGRKIALAVWPKVFDTLDYEDDEAFLEPLIYSAGNFPEIVLDLYELLQPDPSPMELRCKPYFVPNHGYFDTSKNEILPIERASGIEVLLGGIQSMEMLCGKYNLPKIDDSERVKNALYHLANSSPELFDLFERACKRIVLFRAAKSNSFASNAMPNTVFINLSHGDSLPAIIEDLTHQAMHCVFSDVEQSDGLYTAPSEDLLNLHINAISGSRTISVLHHSCLTLASSSKALDNLIIRSRLSDCDTLEAKARIGFLSKKMALDLSTAIELNMLTFKWKQKFWALIAKLRSKNMPEDWLYQSQGYNFNFSAFCAENKRLI